MESYYLYKKAAHSHECALMAGDMQMGMLAFTDGWHLSIASGTQSLVFFIVFFLILNYKTFDLNYSYFLPHPFPQRFIAIAITRSTISTTPYSCRIREHSCYNIDNYCCAQH